MALHDTIIAHEQMTKRFLMGLPEGVFIESDVRDINSEFCPELAEPVAKMDAREDQWKRIKAKELNSRMFAVFASEDDYRLYLRDLWGCVPV